MHETGRTRAAEEGIAFEKLIKLVDSPRGFPTRPSLRTVWRWAMKGSKGRVLETVLVGGTRYTSEEAIRRFLSGGAFRSAEQTRWLHARRASIHKAELELQRDGF